jgi:hypothetical protein
MSEARARWENASLSLWAAKSPGRMCCPLVWCNRYWLLVHSKWSGVTAGNGEEVRKVGWAGQFPRQLPRGADQNALLGRSRGVETFCRMVFLVKGSSFPIHYQFKDGARDGGRYL